MSLKVAQVIDWQNGQFLHVLPLLVRLSSTLLFTWAQVLFFVFSYHVHCSLILVLFSFFFPSIPHGMLVPCNYTSLFSYTSDSIVFACPRLHAHAADAIAFLRAFHTVHLRILLFLRSFLNSRLLWGPISHLDAHGWTQLQIITENDSLYNALYLVIMLTEVFCARMKCLTITRLDGCYVCVEEDEFNFRMHRSKISR